MMAQRVVHPLLFFLPHFFPIHSCDQVFRAQQIRSYLQKGSKPPSLTDKPKTPKEAAKKGAHFYSMLQTEDGHWGGDYGGPHFLMPGLIVAWYVMGKPALMIDNNQAELMIQYIRNHQQKDGGWGTHIESPSTMFGSVLMYVAMRLLGVGKRDPAAEQGRAFIQDNGGALLTSSWAKFSLCLLGVMEWDGHNSVPPEMWLLPNWFPFHPGRLWCHCRMVYLPMGYLYGSRFVYDKAETDPLVQSLRSEVSKIDISGREHNDEMTVVFDHSYRSYRLIGDVPVLSVISNDFCRNNGSLTSILFIFVIPTNQLYIQEYATIDWITTRHMVADMDNYSPIPFVMRFVQDVLARYETWSIFQPFKNYVRKLGLDFSLEYMHAEDLQTNFIDIGPVNKVFNMLSAFHGTLSNRELWGRPKVWNLSWLCLYIYLGSCL